MAEIPDADLAALQARAAAGDTAAAALEAAQTRLAAATAQAAAGAGAVEALLATTRQANPTVPPDLISGATPEEITASATRAQATVKAVLEANQAAAGAAATAPGAAATAPAAGAGAPTRSPAQIPEGLRGAARIRFGLEPKD